MAESKRSFGVLTPVELPAVIAITELMASLWLHAVQAANEAAQRTSCEDNLSARSWDA